MKHMILGSALRLPVVLAILGFATIDATAQEICGLASVQYNLMHSDGFEGAPSSSVAAVASVATDKSDAEPKSKLATQAGALFELGKPMGYAPKIIQGIVPTVAITTPSIGATTPGRRFEIRGTFTGPINTGVTVNGSPARTYGTQWVATPIRPPAGPFTIDVIAKTFDGLTAMASRNITVGDTAPLIELIAKQPGNIAPAKIGFTLRFSGVVSGNVQIDFNGDSISDYDGPLEALPNSYTYPTAGFYIVQVTATVDSILSTAQAVVVIADVIVQRERACAVYSALRNALAANDLEASVHAFTTQQQEALRPFFTALGSNRTVFATRLGTIANGAIGMDGAKLRVLRLEAGVPVLYPLEVGMGEDGVWRLVSF